MRFQQQQARAWASDDAGRRRVAGADRVGNEAQTQGLHARGDEVGDADRTAVGEDDGLPAQVVEGPRRPDQRRAGRLRRFTKPALQVAVFPRFRAPRGKGLGVGQVNLRRRAHAAVGRNLSYPSASSSSASSGPPEATMRPAASTCTLSGLM
ncbi:hypothetical protein D3C85_873580 [compost metagenome]